MTNVEPPAAPEVVPVRKPSRGGRPALILGIIAVILALIPFASYVAWLVAIIAIVIAIVALARATTKRGSAIAGLVLGIVGLLLSIVMSVVYSIVFFVAAVSNSGAIPSALASALPSGFPTALPSDFPSDLPSDFPSDLPSDLPSDFPQATDGPSASPTPGQRAIVLRITGSGTAGAIAYGVVTAAGSSTNRLQSTTLPWSKAIGLQSGTVVGTLTAQSSGGGQVGCEIEIDGKVVAKNQGDGVAYCIGTAQ